LLLINSIGKSPDSAINIQQTCMAGVPEAIAAVNFLLLDGFKELQKLISFG